MPSIPRRLLPELPSLLLVSLALFLVVAPSSPGHAQEPCPTRPCILDLVTGDVTSTCNSDVLSIKDAPTDVSGNGYLESVLEVDVDGGGKFDCSCLTVVLEWDAAATGWSVNLCDSPSNNGFGGDGGQSDFEAELQLLGDELRVYGAFFPAQDPPGVVERIWTQKTQAGSGSLRFRVCDQMVGWGAPEGKLETDDSLMRLFYVPDAGASGPADLFVGLNRVCDASSTLLDRDTGTVRRAYVALE